MNARGLKFEFATLLNEVSFLPVFLYGSETMMWREKEESITRYVQMNSLRGLLGILGEQMEWRMHV